MYLLAIFKPIWLIIRVVNTRSWWTDFRICPEIRLQCGSDYFMIWIRMQTKLTLCLFSNLLQSHQKTEGWWKIFWRDRKTTKIKWAVEWPLFWPAHPWPQRLALELTGEIQLTRSITQQLVSRWYFFGLRVFLPSFVYRIDGQWYCFLVHLVHHWPSTML